MKIIILLLVIIVPFYLFAQSKGQKDILFEENSTWNEIKEKAKKEQKFIFVDAFATWCVPCKKMDKEVFSNDSVMDFIKEHFISIKMQMDSSINDNDLVKKRYIDAKFINDKYEINGFPSFLFFNPDGILIFRGLGFKNIANFIKLAKTALVPQTAYNFTELENYKKGIKKYDEIFDLIMYARTIGEDELSKTMMLDYIQHADRKTLLSIKTILLVSTIFKDSKLANSLAKEYKEIYIDSLAQKELCTKDNLMFLEKFNNLIATKDLIFKLCYTNPEKMDEIIGHKGWSHNKIEQTIKREELDTRLLNANKPLTENPNWGELEVTIRRKYASVDAKLIVLNYKIFYYKKLNDYTQWAYYQDIMINKYPPKMDETSLFFQLNLPAWDAFLHSKDRRVLKKALKWCSLAIKLGGENPNFQCLDTKANILYKLGRTKDAIILEEKAMEMAKKQNNGDGPLVAEFYEAVSQMRTGKPTYLKMGAIWILIPFLDLISVDNFR